LALLFSDAANASLKNSGGSVATTASGYSDPACGQNNIIVVNNGGTYVALSASCPHACCTVDFTGSDFHCPCHGATFDLTGKSTSSRTNQPLQNLTVCSDANGVYITLP
jgi:cytochrome b6-f complex iron-sulfur subunit